MKEDFLYYVWQYQLFVTPELQTVDGQSLLIHKSGEQNFNAGPDFLNAHLKVDNQLWIGNVEMHVKSSDWYLHQHEKDENYDAVILHVVWEHDAAIFMKNDKPLPTLVLKDFVSNQILENYQSLVFHRTKFIPCENQISSIDEFTKQNWLERLYFERLASKSAIITNILATTNYDFEATLFQLLAKNFGLKINGDAFLKLAQSLDFSIVRKVGFDVQKLNALLFGQAGFLNEDLEHHYYQTLQQEYAYLEHKYQLKPLHRNNFQFFRMRPNNFPTIRIAQLGALFHQHQQLFSKLLEITTKEGFYELFKMELDDFWKTHYTFTSTSKKSSKQLTKSFVDLLIINTIIPLKFAYLKHRGEAFEEDILKLVQQLSPEKNSIITNFRDLKVDAQNAMESQALLTVKNNYCTKKRCLQCAIGNKLLRK